MRNRLRNRWRKLSLSQKRWVYTVAFGVVGAIVTFATNEALVWLKPRLPDVLARAVGTMQWLLEFLPSVQTLLVLALGASVPILIDLVRRTPSLARQIWARIPTATRNQPTEAAHIQHGPSGTFDIRESYNVSSVTDHGTGDTTVTFAAPSTSIRIQAPPTAPRQLLPDEVNDKFRAVKLISDFVKLEMESTIDDAPSLRGLAWEVFQDRERNAPYQVSMDAYISKVRDDATALNRLRKQTDYPDISKAAEPICSNALETAAGDYKHRFAVVMTYVKPDTPYQYFWELMEPHGSAFDAALRAFSDWREKARHALGEIRSRLPP